MRLNLRFSEPIKDHLQFSVPLLLISIARFLLAYAGLLLLSCGVLLWEALTRDRRFAGRGFKRQVPIGPHIVDIVSFPLRTVIELVPPEESAEAEQTRAERRTEVPDGHARRRGRPPDPDRHRDSRRR